MRKWNFCAGPAVISEEVLEEVKSELLEYNNSGTSIMEVSLLPLWKFQSCYILITQI